MSIASRIRAWFFPDAVHRAQTAEARGDLERAAAAWAEARRYADAVRVLLLRAHGEADPHRRAMLHARATSIVPPGDPAGIEAWRSRAAFVLDRAEAGALGAALRRRELLEAGQALRDLGETGLAAHALRLAGDLEGEIDALAEGGAVGPLEEALARNRELQETRRRRAARFGDARDLIAVGRRRDALDLLRAGLAEDDAEDLRALVEGLLTRRPRLPATVYLQGRQMELVPGNPVTLGRSEGELRIHSPLVSRRHLEFERRDGADPWVKDLGGKNGTTIRGAHFEVLPVGTGLDLVIGNSLPLRVRPSESGGVLCELPGRLAWLPLGPVDFRGLTGSFESTPDGWLELVIPRGESVVLGDLRVEGAIQLLRGDEIFDRHGGRLLLRVVAPVGA